MALGPTVLHDERIKVTGVFWFSKAQLHSLLDYGHSRKFCKIWKTGEIREYTEMVSHATLKDDPYEMCEFEDAYCLGEGEFYGWDRLPNVEEIGKLKYKYGR